MGSIAFTEDGVVVGALDVVNAADAFGFKSSKRSNKNLFCRLKTSMMKKDNTFFRVEASRDALPFCLV